MGRGIVEQIHEVNTGRDPDRLLRKYRAMADSPFAFFRGTCPLFYADFPLQWDAPAAWVCGDLHMENFGTYKAVNRLVYFDINDYDEGLLAPCTWDVGRFVVGLLVAAPGMKLGAHDAYLLVDDYLDAYVAALRAERAGWVERALTVGMVRELMVALKNRPRRALLDRYSERDGRERALRPDGVQVLPVSKEQRRRIRALVNEWRKTQPNPDFYRPLDIGQRVHGLGSLGVQRYMLLVEGSGTPNENYLLDLKEQPEASGLPYVKVPQPDWDNPAARVVTLNLRCPAVPRAHQAAVTDGDTWFSLREIQPLEQKIRLYPWDGKFKQLRRLMATMGEITAWNHLRASGRQGAANADALSTFAAVPTWRVPLVNWARTYAEQVARDWQEWVEEKRF